MSAERLFYPAVLAGCAVLTLLSLSLPSRMAASAAQAQPVVQLERVVITAQRLEPTRQVASTAGARAEATPTR